MILKTLLIAWLALPASLGGAVWDKAPDKWSLSDVYHILRDSPWSPTDVKVEVKSAPRQVNAQSGPVTDPINSNDANTVPGVQLSRSKPEAPIPVIWWSSKTIRLAEQRLRQLQNSPSSKEALAVPALPDYVLVIEGTEPFRILHDPNEDLHDTIFMELPDGTTLDLASVRFVEGGEGEEPRVELHFPREVDGQPAFDPDADRVILHCRASAKTPRPFENNSLALRADFRPKAMKVRGVSDL